jgi:3'-phosphoadenosine 5'-phosphosulfate sulfotransferase (PAPS reductase)/FAD synthetase
MNEPRILCWFSRGAASAVMTKLMLSTDRNQDAIPVTCVTGSEHPDNDRFEAECEAWFGCKITRLQNTKYSDTWEVWEERRFIAGINGAPCTVALKVEPRLDFQRVDDIHVFGYTADKLDIARAKRLRETFFEMTIETPLIDRGLDKAACMELVQRAGLTLPITYEQGFPNANCLPCGKATSPNYWALFRLHYPEKFDRMAKLARELGARMTRINNERVFIDEIPADWPTTNPVVPSCDFLCQLAEQEIH